MTDDPELITQQLDHSLDNILTVLEETSRELERDQDLIKIAGAWIEKHWGSKYDILPTWARGIVDESRNLASVEAKA